MESTSEQELKLLLEEGKISEDEYRQLLEAIKRKHLNASPINRLRLSRNKPKARAILFTAITVGSLCLFSIIMDNQQLRNKPIVIGLQMSSIILAGIMASHYWMVYMKSEK
jgi:nicotinamide riboside transporter PnuC